MHYPMRKDASYFIPRGCALILQTGTATVAVSETKGLTKSRL